jgi:hypothetical protein
LLPQVPGLSQTVATPDRVRAVVLIDSQAGLEDPAVAPGYEQMHQAWLEHGPGPVQEVVASTILGPGTWDGVYGLNSRVAVLWPVAAGEVAGASASRACSRARISSGV